MPLFAKVLAVALACGALTLALPAMAETKKDKKDKETEQVASYGDWSVNQSKSGKEKVCYALASPKTRDPEDLKRDPGYAFISDRPNEHVHNEISFVMGFEVGVPEPAKDSPDKKKDKDKKPKFVTPTATVGDSQFELLPKGGNLWVKNAAEESKLIEAMRHGAKLEVRASSKKGASTTDSYSLTGFKQAIEKAAKDCGGHDNAQ